jgi:hypothetical protein
MTIGILVYNSYIFSHTPQTPLQEVDYGKGGKPKEKV